jgi:hypothetical protein
LSVVLEAGGESELRPVTLIKNPLRHVFNERLGHGPGVDLGHLHRVHPQLGEVEVRADRVAHVDEAAADGPGAQQRLPRGRRVRVDAADAVAVRVGEGVAQHRLTTRVRHPVRVVAVAPSPRCPARRLMIKLFVYATHTCEKRRVNSWKRPK